MELCVYNYLSSLWNCYQALLLSFKITEYFELERWLSSEELTLLSHRT